jgi:thymidylate synthase (FAD)
MIKATYIDHMGNDLRTSNSARVSFKKKREEFLFEGDPRVRPTGRSDEKLIYDLAEEGHIAPFGHSYILFHIKAPIFVARQLVKHKFLRWSEVSRRYVDDEPEFYVPEVWRGRAEDKKQGSSGEVKVPYMVPHEFNKSALYEYETLLESGVAPEQARMVLPQSTMTEWYWSGSLDAFASMCVLRLKEDTQYETRLVAQQISEKMKDLFPVSWRALVNAE